jgi:hypothetical protein
MGEKDHFLKYARLARVSRKYCSCVMEVRKKSNGSINPYAVCINSVYKTRKLKKPYNLECGLNYDLDSYSLEHIQQYAKEKNIPLTYINKEGKKKERSKGYLIRKLRDYMISKKQESMKKLKLNK